MLPPKAAAGTKADPNLVPSITNKGQWAASVKRTMALLSGSGCTKVRPREALAVEPTVSWCLSSWPAESLH